jgi:signal transduction histidine kinase/CheY-like chemotaxis protein
MRRYSSLRWKLTALIAGGSIVAAVIAAAGFSLLDLKRFWLRSTAEVQAVGNVVADQVGPAIAMGDHKAAGEILFALRSDTLIQTAALYDASGTCFATYQRLGAAGCLSQAMLPVDSGSQTIVVSLPVMAGADRLGTLVLSASVPSVPELLWPYSGGVMLIIVMSLIVAGIMGMVLQSRVSAPILEVANVAQRIAETHQFHERVTLAAADELGLLADSFNAMLCEIQRRDSELAQHRKSLEEEVAERSRVNSELLLAKEKAEDATRLKSEFLANMSHEIRTPLNGVMGMISLVLDRCIDAEEREQLLVAESAARSLITILNDILDLSKVEAGKMTLETIDFELAGAVGESTRIFNSTVRQKCLDLQFTIDPQLPVWVRGDPARLRQVLVNLIGNAVKFTNAGSVRISVESVRGGARFSVADTGIGIPPEKLGSVFDAFTQADGSHTRRFGGTGLGLTITRRLVDLMGGRLWAESAIGEGSRFCFELPLAAASPPAHEAVAGCAATATALPELQVLVAEDNPINQKVICAMLRRQKWSVTVASNGVEAWNLFRDGRFDLILMDVQMPEMDGLEATRLIRREEQRRAASHRIPIMALTAHASPVQHEEYLAEGMDGVLTKPINLPTLLDGIHSMMRTPDAVLPGA